MWREIVEYFRESPQRLRVAQAIVRHGFRIERPGIVKCGEIRIPLKALGDSLEIDRRTVKATAEDICQNERLCQFFSRLEPAGPSLERVREVLGYGVVKIHVESPANAGILSEVTSTIASYGISIRQVLAEDIEIYENPCLKVITDEPLPGSVIETLTAVKGVNRVVIEK
ncbi:MAG: amino acid-binding protein [Candidatus Thorarchaeota archaeon]|nr:amino acid-binding protein [Candidatus Thorarchaeota archaeon]